MKRGLSPELITRAIAGSSLEFKLTDALAFGLTTASPLQRAVCRVADGVPLGELAGDRTVIAALGNVHALSHERPHEVVVLSGIRTAKSLIAACGAFHMATTCDVSSLRPGEVPRVSVVSTKKDNADVVMNHLVGSVKASPLLSRFLLGEPSGDGLLLRHPSGVPVEVCVVAGSRAGSSLVSRWSAGCIFDEFPRMVGGDEGVVNWDDSRQAVIHRLLRGCQLWHIGSPWAPYGPAYETVTAHHGKPTRDLVVVRAPAPAMNPVYWTPDRCTEAKRRDPEAYRTDVLAEFATPEEALFSSDALDRCMRKEPLHIPPKPGNTYYAAMDPATRGNGWTLAIATRENGKTIIVRAEEWVGTRDEPLDPGEVLAKAAGILVAYGVTSVDSDQVMGDALITLGRQAGIRIHQWRYSSEERAKKFLSIRARIDSNELELPPIQKMRTDLLHIRKRVTPAGMSIVLPMTSDGRHCDWGPTLMLVLSRLLPEPPTPTPAGRGDDPETKRIREEMLKRWGAKKGGNW